MYITLLRRKIPAIFFTKEPKSKLVATLRVDQGRMALAVALGIDRGYTPPIEARIATGG